MLVAGAEHHGVDLPAAALVLAQGAGRLIRTRNDRGVVAVLDSRLALKDYRHQLLTAIPPLKRSVDLDEACEFLGHAASNVPASSTTAEDPMPAQSMAEAIATRDAVDCPECDVKAGDRCLDAAGFTLTFPHAARVAAMESA